MNSTSAVAVISQAVSPVSAAGALGVYASPWADEISGHSSKPSAAGTR